MTPAQTWLLIAIGIPAVMLAAWWLTYWLEGRDPEPPSNDVAAVRLRCECGRYVFLCGDPGTPHRHQVHEAGTVHRPDLCQPADEAL
jgi:hypothetical protein